MGKIIQNGIEYSGTYSNATSINYDSSASGLNAKTVQEAVDELAAGGSGDSLSVCDLLASSNSTGSNNTIILDKDINDYKFIRLALNLNTEELGSNMIPVSLFKASTDKFNARAYITSTGHLAETKYISETEMLLRVSVNGDTAILYGIK